MVVTGGCGFIGSHLVERLLELGAVVKVLGRYNSGSDRGFLEGLNHPNLEVTLGDVADPWFVDGVVAGSDTVFHLAALIGIPYSYLAPWHYVSTNVTGTACVLEAVRRHGVRRMVHTSTSETYGTAQYTPIDEAHPLVGQSPYSATKIAADKLVESYVRSFDLPVATIRPFNTYGPRQSMRAVIPSIVTQALHGQEISVGSLSPVRDMNYVADTVEGFVGMGRAPGVDGEVVNVGSGVGRSIDSIVRDVLRITGVDRPVRVASERERPAASEVEVLLCDYRKANALFGYEPSVDFDEGLRRVCEFVERHPPADDVAVYRR